MSRNKRFKPPSLAQHFDAPDGFVGHFGWMCGYSADAPFLNNAAERFTRQTLAQRRYSGRISLALILDPGNSPITLLDVPGVLHLPVLRPEALPFRLMHAKVAVLGFRQTNSDAWLLRLIVSTGNWTRETVEKSLDLAWCVDIRSADIDQTDTEIYQACADIKAAWQMLHWLRSHFDSRTLTGGGHESGRASRQVEDWISQAYGRARGSARFFDNREQSLLAQLVGMIKAAGVTRSLNYIGMGSGFYEGTAVEGEVPSVLARIVRTLQDNSLLTRTSEVDVFVNPTACQAVADSLGKV